MPFYLEISKNITKQQDIYETFIYIYILKFWELFLRIKFKKMRKKMIFFFCGGEGVERGKCFCIFWAEIVLISCELSYILFLFNYKNRC